MIKDKLNIMVDDSEGVNEYTESQNVYVQTRGLVNKLMRCGRLELVIL